LPWPTSSLGSPGAFWPTVAVLRPVPWRDHRRTELSVDVSFPRGLRECETRWRFGLPGADGIWWRKWPAEAYPLMRSSARWPEAPLQSEAGYINARPRPPDRRNTLATHGRTIHCAISRRNGDLLAPPRTLSRKSDFSRRDVLRGRPYSGSFGDTAKGFYSSSSLLRGMWRSSMRATLIASCRCRGSSDG
jgi:hypothetical protein